MINENTIDDIYDKFGIESDEVIIEEFKKIIENKNTSNTIKSMAYCGIGDVIICFDPESSEDAGYGYYKKALEYDENNLNARVGMCMIFDEYPAPDYNILTEKEYLDNLEILLNKFDKISEEYIKKNIIQLMKNLVEYRLKKL